MAITPTSPLPGGDINGFTSPTFTLAEDSAPNAHSKQWYVSALGGTPLSLVEKHQVSKPFTLTFERPAILRSAGTPNPTTGVISNVPMNVYKVRTRKGVNVDSSGDNTRIAIIETKISIPAGADVNDMEDVQAAVSAHAGLLTDTSDGLGDTVITGAI